MDKRSNSTKLKWVKRTAGLLDSKFKIPGTNIRFGLDPVFSLFPFLGDLASSGMSLLLIKTMNTHGASGALLTKMIINVILDMLIGSIPIIGTIFDVAYKANDRNVKLLEEYYEEGKHQGSGKKILTLVSIILVALVVGLIYLSVLFVRGLLELLNN